MKLTLVLLTLATVLAAIGFTATSNSAAAVAAQINSLLCMIFAGLTLVPRDWLPLDGERWEM